MMKILAVVFLFAATPVFADRAVTEGKPSTNYSILVSSTANQVSIGTNAAYGGSEVNVALYVASNVAVGTTGCVIYSSGSATCPFFSGDGSGLFNLSATALPFDVAYWDLDNNWRVPQTFVSSVTVVASIEATGSSVTASAFFGDGSHLTNIPGGSVAAGNITGGPVNSAILPSTVAYTSKDNNWSASQTFQSSITLTGEGPLSVSTLTAHNTNMLITPGFFSGGPTSVIIRGGTSGTFGSGGGVIIQQGKSTTAGGNILFEDKNGSVMTTLGNDGSWDFTGGGATANLTTPSSVTASAFFGDGSHLTGMTATACSPGSNTGSVVCSGSGNADFNNYGTVSGGLTNETDSIYGTVAGGHGNRADGTGGTISGGDGNRATGQYDVIGGGSSNHADGTASMVPGGGSNTASGDYSLAAGQSATATGANSFTWSDGTTFADRNIRTFNAAALNGFFLTGASVTASGYINAGSSVNATAFFGDGSHLTGISGGGGSTPNTFNSSTTFNAPILITGSSITLTGSAGYISGASSVTASAFFGNGSGLTNLSGGNINSPLASSVLPSTVAYTTKANTFSSSQTITGGFSASTSATANLSVILDATGQLAIPIGISSTTRMIPYGLIGAISSYTISGSTFADSSNIMSASVTVPGGGLAADGDCIMVTWTMVNLGTVTGPKNILMINGKSYILSVSGTSGLQTTQRLQIMRTAANKQKIDYSIRTITSGSGESISSINGAASAGAFTPAAFTEGEPMTINGTSQINSGGSVNFLNLVVGKTLCVF